MVPGMMKKIFYDIQTFLGNFKLCIEEISFKNN
jgi:hypothetical protein